jgi:hypothetical protein
MDPKYGLVWSFEEEMNQVVVGLENIHPDVSTLQSEGFGFPTSLYKVTTVGSMNFESEVQFATLNEITKENTTEVWDEIPDAWYRFSIIQIEGEGLVYDPSRPFFSQSRVGFVPEDLEVVYNPYSGQYKVSGFVRSLYNQVPSIKIPPEAKFDTDVLAGGNYFSFSGPANHAYAFKFTIKADVYLNRVDFETANPEFTTEQLDDAETGTFFPCNIYTPEEYQDYMEERPFDEPLIIEDSTNPIHEPITGIQGGSEFEQTIIVYLTPNDLREVFITRYGDERLQAELSLGLIELTDLVCELDEEGNKVNCEFYEVDGQKLTGEEYVAYLTSNGFIRRFS